VALLTLGELRDSAAAALAPAIDTDPMVFADIVEATVPPALVIEWDDPWLEPGAGLPTMGPCIYTARLRVVMIAARLDPGAGYDEIDRLAAYVLGRMRADPYSWTLDSVTRPDQVNQAGIDSIWAYAHYTAQTSI
jgi:hypothetical protein